MWNTMEELAEQYRAEAQHLDEVIDRAAAHPNPDLLEQDRRMRILRTMRRDAYETYRHLLWYLSPAEPRQR